MAVRATRYHAEAFAKTPLRTSPYRLRLGLQLVLNSNRGASFEVVGTVVTPAA